MLTKEETKTLIYWVDNIQIGNITLDVDSGKVDGFVRTHGKWTDDPSTPQHHFREIRTHRPLEDFAKKVAKNLGVEDHTTVIEAISQACEQTYLEDNPDGTTE